MRALPAVMTALLLTSSAGCYRTHYLHLHGEDAPPPAASAVEAPGSSGWRHFFLYGLVPGVVRVDAAAECGGSERVERIETRQTFLQGLVETIASFYINIYSPWTGRVVCRQSAPDS